MQQTEAQVKVDSQLTEPINIVWGLKQGDGSVSYTHLSYYDSVTVGSQLGFYFKIE